MLRNTSDGNELAVPATNAYRKEHSASSWYTVVLMLAVGCCTVACVLTI